MVLATGSEALAQAEGFRLDEQGRWVRTEAPAEGTPSGELAAARKALANGEAGRSYRLADRWVREYGRSGHPQLAEGILLRGDACAAMGDEFQALFDYERVILDHPDSPAFVTAVERELSIATAYVNGTKRKGHLGLRINDASRTGEELLIRVQERMPGSQIAEQAGIELADYYYYRERDLRLAAEAYELFVENYPLSRWRMKAMRQRIYANIGRFKGPKFDASGLVEARFLIEDFAGEFPAEAERAGLSDALVARIDESIAAQKLDKAKWYLRRGDVVSARFVLRRLRRDYPTTVAATRALEILVERGWIEPGARGSVAEPEAKGRPAPVGEGGAAEAGGEEAVGDERPADAASGEGGGG